MGSRLLKDQVQMVSKKDSDRYEVVPIQEPLSFEKGFFVVIRACQLLTQKNNGLILVGVAGPSGAGRAVFTEKVLDFMPSIAVVTMDNYNNSSRIIDGNFYMYSMTSIMRIAFDGMITLSGAWPTVVNLLSVIPFEGKLSEFFKNHRRKSPSPG